MRDSDYCMITLKSYRSWGIAVGWLILVIALQFFDLWAPLVLSYISLSGEDKISFEFFSIIFSAPVNVFIRNGVIFVGCIPLLFKLISCLSRWHLTKGVPKGTKEKLERIIDCLVHKEPQKRFFGKTYVQRGVCPTVLLSKNRHVDPNFLMLIRGLEEVRAFENGKRDTSVQFKRLQEEDYKTLFQSAKESYYVTSYHDHDVWAIFEGGDLDYYVKNYAMDRKLKKRNRWWWRLRSMAPLEPGIHRIFVITADEAAASDVSSTVIQNFKEALKKFISTDYTLVPIKDIAKSLSIETVGIAQPDIKSIVREKLIIQLLYLLLGLKIHKELGIHCIGIEETNFSRGTDDEKKLLALYSTDDAEEWISIGWKRLGSAMIDGIEVAYADQKRDETLVAYKFMHGIPESFHRAAQNIFNRGQSFESVNSTVINLCENDAEFNEIARKIANRIKEQYKKTKFFNRLLGTVARQK